MLEAGKDVECLLKTFTVTVQWALHRWDKRGIDLFSNYVKSCGREGIAIHPGLGLAYRGEGVGKTQAVDVQEVTLEKTTKPVFKTLRL